MGDLGACLATSVRKLVEEKYQSDSSIAYIVNENIDLNTDFEHVITFLDESPSALHRRFADDLRKIFEKVLRRQLEAIENELQGTPTSLYLALLDMYQVPRCPEELTDSNDQLRRLHREGSVGRRGPDC